MLTVACPNMVIQLHLCNMGHLTVAVCVCSMNAGCHDLSASQATAKLLSPDQVPSLQLLALVSFCSAYPQLSW